MVSRISVSFVEMNVLHVRCLYFRSCSTLLFRLIVYVQRSFLPDVVVARALHLLCVLQDELHMVFRSRYILEYKISYVLQICTRDVCTSLLYPPLLLPRKAVNGYYAAVFPGPRRWQNMHHTRMTYFRCSFLLLLKPSSRISCSGVLEAKRLNELSNSCPNRFLPKNVYFLQYVVVGKVLKSDRVYNKVY